MTWPCPTVPFPPSEGQHLSQCCPSSFVCVARDVRLRWKRLTASLVGKITGFLKGLSSTPATPPASRSETTETSTTAGVIDYYYQLIKLERSRKAKYNDYEIMDEEYPEVSTAIDAFADNATKELDEEGDTIELKSDNPRVQNILDELVDRYRSAGPDVVRKVYYSGIICTQKLTV